MYKAKNPYVRNGILSDLVLTGDAEFSKNGAVEVWIGSLQVYKNTDSDSFKDLKQVTLPYQGRIIEAGRSIEVFVWRRNEESTKPVALTVNGGIYGTIREANVSVIPADEIEIDVDNTDVVNAIEAIPETPATDVTPIVDAINDKPVTPATDTTPIVDAINTARLSPGNNGSRFSPFNG